MTAILALGALILAALAALLALALVARGRAVARLRQRVQRLETAARDGEQLREKFLEQLAHELRTPLTAILGYQELLGDGIYGDLGDPCNEAVRRIGRASQQLQHLIDGMFEVFLDRDSAPDLDLESVDTDALFASIEEYARSVAAERGVAVETFVDTGLPRITTDPHRLYRALYMAVLSAVRASNGGSLRVHARSPEPQLIELEITGTGLDPDPVERPLTPALAGAPAHLGLRLSIARRVARTLGGDLALEPADDGTTLRLRVRGTSGGTTAADRPPASSSAPID